MILKLPYALGLLWGQELFFFSGSAIDFDGGVAAVLETEGGGNGKSIITEVRVNGMTTEPR